MAMAQDDAGFGRADWATKTGREAAAAMSTMLTARRKRLLDDKGKKFAKSRAFMWEEE